MNKETASAANSDTSECVGSVLNWEKFADGKYCARLAETILTLYWCNGLVHLVISGATSFNAPDFETGKLEAEQAARDLVKAWDATLSPNDSMSREGDKQ